jgi:hypothetical protein
VVCLEEYLMWGHLKFQVLMKWSTQMFDYTNESKQ